MAEVDDRFAAMGVDDNRPVGPIVVELQCLGRLLVSCLRNITLKVPQPDTSHGVEIQRTGITHVDAFAAVGYQLSIRPVAEVMVTATTRKRLGFILVAGETCRPSQVPVSRQQHLETIPRS